MYTTVMHSYNCEGGKRGRVIEKDKDKERTRGKIILKLMQKENLKSKK